MKTYGKVLIVDDDPTHLYLMQSILHEDGYITEVIANPKEVVNTLETNEFKILLLDIMMPGMDGFEVLQEIRTRKNLAKVKVIIISAKTDSWSIKNALDLGAFDYITKPIDVQDIRNKVKSAMIDSIKK
ncbi:PleD family two-component system response regulator [Bacteroidota bacterium]